MVFIRRKPTPTQKTYAAEIRTQTRQTMTKWKTKSRKRGIVKNYSSLPCYHALGPLSMCKQTHLISSFAKFWSVHITFNTQVFELFKRKVCLSSAACPSNCTNNVVWLLWWGLSRPHLQSQRKMKNDDIKERWKYFNLTIETQRLGKCSRTAIQSQPNSSFFFFFIYYGLTSLCIWSMLSMLSFHVISSHQPEDLYNYLLLYSLWFENNPPELYLVNSLDSLKKSPMNPEYFSSFIMFRIYYKVEVSLLHMQDDELLKKSMCGLGV